MQLREAHLEEFQAILEGCYARVRPDAPREAAAAALTQLPMEF